MHGRRYPVAIYLLLREFPMKQTLMVVFYFVLLASTAFGCAVSRQRVVHAWLCVP